MYSNYIVLIYKNGFYISYDYDLAILKYFGIDFILNNNINYIILDNLDLQINQFLDNQYFYYFKIILIKKFLDFIIKKDASKYKEFIKYI